MRPRQTAAFQHEGLQAHLPHQPLNPLAVHPPTFAVQPVNEVARPELGIGQVQLVDRPHQGQVLRRGRPRAVIMRRPRHPEDLTLELHRHLWMVLLDQPPPTVRAQAPQLFFRPIDLNLQLADFFVKLLFPLGGRLRVVVGLLAEQFGQAIGDLFLPGGHLGRVHPVAGCDHMDRLDALEGV